MGASAVASRGGVLGVWMAGHEPFIRFDMLRYLRWMALVVFALSVLLTREARAQVEGLRGARLAGGQLVPVGDELEAGPEGAMLALEQGATLRAEPGTLFRFAKHMKLPMGSGPDPMVPARVLLLNRGSISASLPATKRFALIMLGPRKLRAIVSAGEATMLASEQRATVASLTGSTLVTFTEKWRQLHAGSVQLISDTRPEGWRRDILGAPGAPVLSRSMLMAGEGAESSTIVAWPALSGASSYDLRLTGPGDVVIRREQTRVPRLILSALPAGSYQMQVHGIDDSGLPGAVSEPVALNVVGLDIPATASRSPEGAVRLQPGQRVSLVGAEGLEVGYLGLDSFLPVPKTLGLVARRPIAMLLRHPRSGETLRLNLEPLSVRADISFAQHPDSWPSQGLEVTVKLVDEHGYPVPENFAVSFRVSVNITLAVPQWQRDGSTLRASIARPEGAGPWMVRVDVLDESGRSLGMNFAEIAYRTAGTQARGR